MSPLSFFKTSTMLDRAIVASVAAMLAMNLGVMAQQLGGVPHPALTQASASTSAAFPA